MKSIKRDILFRVLFSLVFWFFWLVLPLLNSILDGDDNRYSKLITLLPVNLLAVPFFYINAEYFAPKMLKKKQVPQYLLSIVIVFVTYLFSYVILKDYIIDHYPIRVYDSRTLFPVIFITGMSTLYGLAFFLITEINRGEQEKEERMKSELSFLRSQISPHFIFNILNSIVYLIRVKSEDAEKVTIELSKLIRYMLYESENKSVLLEKELEYLDNYVGLQKVRFGEDVDIQIHFSGPTSNLSIEPMLLIPFVENAFKHGVGLTKDPFIKIDIKVSNENQLDFWVSNKCGNENSEIKDPDSGIGIKNVRRRIELLYPDRHTLTLREDNGVFDVYLKLTLKKSEK